MAEMFVDVEKGLEVLSSLPAKEIRKHRRNTDATLLKLVENGFDKIEELVRNGYTHKEISGILRKRLGITFPTTTFSTYLSKVRRMRKMAQQEEEAR